MVEAVEAVEAAGAAVAMSHTLTLKRIYSVALHEVTTGGDVKVSTGILSVVSLVQTTILIGCGGLVMFHVDLDRACHRCLGSGNGGDLRRFFKAEEHRMGC